MLIYMDICSPSTIIINSSRGKAVLIFHATVDKN